MQQYYGDEVRIIPSNGKKSRKSRVSNGKIGKKFVVTLVVLCVLALFFVAFYSPLPPDKARIFTRSWYFIKTHGESDYEKVVLESENAKERGGSGYIINDGNFIVTVAVFNTKVSADKVAQKNDGAQVYEVVINGSVIDRNDVLISALNIHDQIYDDLYTNLVDFESGKRSESLVLFCVENWIDKTQKIQSELSGENYSLVINYLEKIKLSLKNLIGDESHGVSSRIRCALCEIVYERAKLSKML